MAATPPPPSPSQVPALPTASPQSTPRKAHPSESPILNGFPPTPTQTSFPLFRRQSTEDSLKSPTALRTRTMSSLGLVGSTSSSGLLAGKGGKEGGAEKLKKVFARGKPSTERVPESVLTEEEKDERLLAEFKGSFLASAMSINPRLTLLLLFCSQDPSSGSLPHLPSSSPRRRRALQVRDDPPLRRGLPRSRRRRGSSLAPQRRSMEGENPRGSETASRLRSEPVVEVTDGGRRLEKHRVVRIPSSTHPVVHRLAEQLYQLPRTTPSPRSEHEPVVVRRRLRQRQPAELPFRRRRVDPSDFSLFGRVRLALPDGSIATQRKGLPLDCGSSRRLALHVGGGPDRRDARPRTVKVS